MDPDSEITYDKCNDSDDNCDGNDNDCDGFIDKEGTNAVLKDKTYAPYTPGCTSGAHYCISSVTGSVTCYIACIAQQEAPAHERAAQPSCNTSLHPLYIALALFYIAPAPHLCVRARRQMLFRAMNDP